MILYFNAPKQLNLNMSNIQALYAISRIGDPTKITGSIHNLMRQYSTRYNDQGYNILRYWQGEDYYSIEYNLHNHPTLLPYRIHNIITNRLTEWFETSIEIIENVVSIVIQQHRNYLQQILNVSPITNKFLILQIKDEPIKCEMNCEYCVRRRDDNERSGNHTENKTHTFCFNKCPICIRLRDKKNERKESNDKPKTELIIPKISIDDPKRITELHQCPSDEDIVIFLARSRELHKTIKEIQKDCKDAMDEIKERNGGTVPSLMFMGVKFPSKQISSGNIVN
ncbi:Hypothetical protein HVR_LOCUS634 [uncultured virus]|nr:Hypothetical protein HVR_LOCUS634 [uncultured virus]